VIIIIIIGGMLTLEGRLTALLLLVAVLSITAAQCTETEDVCDSQTASASPSSSSELLQRLLISFLPALTENKGRSKHVVGAFKCALQVWDKFATHS